MVTSEQNKHLVTRRTSVGPVVWTCQCSAKEERDAKTSGSSSELLVSIMEIAWCYHGNTVDGPAKS